MARRVLLLLGVERSEEPVALLMIAHSFFMGTATVFFETAASATFLARFNASYLPWVYIAAAGVNTVTGAAYTRAQSRLTFSGLMKGTLAFLLALVLAVRFGFALSDVPWVAFAGLVSYRIISSLTDLEYWAVASRIYDVGQAKRLFGLVGTGEVVARIVGALCVPFLVRASGVANLMLVSAGALAACLFVLGRILRRAGGGVPSRRVSEEPETAARRSLRDSLREIVSSSYLLIVVLVAVLATFGKYFVDFAFLEQIGSLGEGEAGLATVLAIFSAVTQALSLLTRVFISRPLLARLGIRIGVLLLPLAHLICCVLVVGAGALGAAGAVFWLVVANQGIYKTLKHPIDHASFKVLYQPLGTRQRLAAQIAVEIIFSPVVVGLAGIVMLLFSTVVRYDPVHFALVLTVVCAAWLVAARSAGRAYATEIRDLLRARGSETRAALALDDATTLSLLYDRLDSDNPAEATVALSLLDTAKVPDLEQILEKQARHPAPSVRREAVARLVALRPDSIDGLATYAEDADPLVERAALVALAGRQEPAARALVESGLGRLSADPDASRRALAADVAGVARDTATVLRLLDDPESSVRRRAMIAAGRTGDPTMRERLESALYDPRFAQAAAQGLAAAGDGLLPEIDAKLARGVEPLLARRLVYVYDLVGSPAAAEALFQHLDFPDVAVRGRIFHVLDRLGFHASVASARKRLRDRLSIEAADLAWVLSARRALPEHAELDLVREALREEILVGRRRILHLLGCLHDRSTIRSIALHVTHPSKSKRAFAQELLELSLPRDERALLVPLLVESEEVPPLPMASDAVVGAVAARDPIHLRAWTRAIASYVLDQRSAERAPGESFMLLVEKVILLKTVSMFAETRTELVAEIASIVELRDLAAGEVLFEKGEVGDSMYIVASGAVRVYDGDTTLSILREREFFGELALLDPELRSASVAAVEATRLFRLDGDLFAQLMAANVDVVRGILHVLCGRLRRTSASVGRV